MFEAFVNPPADINVSSLDVPAIEYRAVSDAVTPQLDLTKFAIERNTAPLTQLASSALITPKASSTSRTLGAQLAQQSVTVTRLTSKPTEASLVTTQSFLKQQNLQGGAVPITQTDNTVAQGVNPNLSPETRTRTEIVEEQIDENTKFQVNQIEITGNTSLPEEELTAFTQPLEGKQISLPELRQAVDSITQLYLSKGFINSRAFLGNQDVTDGKVTIQILEGSVEDIQVEGNQRLPDSYILDRLTAGIATPLRGDKLEEQLRLLQIDPALTSVEASLSPGSGPGKSVLTVRVKESKSAYFGITSDNYSSPFVGSERYGIYGGLRSTFVPGDDFFASYNRTTSGGSDALDFLYRTPVNKQNGTLQLRIAPSWYNITDNAIPFDIDGNSQLYELTFRQPLYRTFRKEFALSLGFAIQNGETDVGGTNLFDTNNRARVLKFGQDFLSRDAQGVWAGQSSFNLGLDIFNATERAGSEADGEFFSWTGQLQRVQRFNADNVLIAQLNMQFSPDPLLPSQQFIIGGGQSVRGYRQNARFGDNGVRFSLEHRTVVARNGSGVAIAQVAPFFDLGTVWNVSDNPTASPDERFLAGAGLGLILQPLPGLNMRFDYAIPFRTVAEKNDNLQDQAFYFSLGYQPQ